MTQRRTSQNATPVGASRRSMALGDKDPRARREADSGMNGSRLATDRTLSYDAATGKLTVNLDEVRKRLTEDT